MQRIDVKVRYVSNKVMVTLWCNLNKGSRDGLKSLLATFIFSARAGELRRNPPANWVILILQNDLKNIAFFFFYILQEFKI